ncbi:MAG: protoheme IX farnesyltransferase [Gammaproteobacteria bacterium HGW-Gammaproteobacteria-4]|jgi:protoheme IX farnesyltransferase|nr:MAG: protoheme IX farnesyltransferase [Gammaproteobacteria bacterium HGW-Gammaproteobacteria-4]
MNTVLAVPEASAPGLVRAVIGLFKLRIGTLIAITALVGFVVTPGGDAGAMQALVLTLGTLMASASAGAFNQYHEHATDRLMLRTRNRAFVTGVLPRHRAWLLLFALMLAAGVGTVWLLVNPLAAMFVFLGAFFYAIVYTVWLKRRSWLNIVVGGLSGSFAVLAGGAAANPAFGPLPWLFALILFLWTPPHFWSLAIAGQSDYKAAGIPMLPVVVGSRRAARVVYLSTWALVLASIAPVGFGMGALYLVGAAVGGAYFICRAAQLARLQDRQTAIRCFLASLLQLSAVLIAACFDAALR